MASSVFKVIGLEQKEYDFQGNQGICTKVHLLVYTEGVTGLTTCALKCSKNFDVSDVNIGAYCIPFYDRYGRLEVLNYNVAVSNEVKSAFETVLLS